MTAAFSPVIEAAIADAWADREAVRAYVWDGVCRTRIKRYRAVEAWAERYAAGEYGTGEEARAALQAAMASNP